jgi:hypothetical protein
MPNPSAKRFFVCKNLFARCKYTHFTTGQYKNPKSLITYLLTHLLTRLLTHSSAPRPSESHGLFNYGRPFFTFDSLPSPSLNLHLPQILLSVFQTSQSRSAHSSTCLRFTCKCFLNCPFMAHLTTRPSHFF